MKVGIVVLYKKDEKLFGEISAVINPIKIGNHRHATYFEPEEFPEMIYDEIYCRFEGNIELKDILSVEIQELDTVRYVGELCETNACIDILELEYIKSNNTTVLKGR